MGEPIVKHGPFAMTTDGEIEQVIKDFRSGNQERKSITWPRLFTYSIKCGIIVRVVLYKGPVLDSHMNFSTNPESH